MRAVLCAAVSCWLLAVGYVIGMLCTLDWDGFFIALCCLCFIGFVAIYVICVAG
jgi:hypothetical protein